MTKQCCRMRPLRAWRLAILVGAIAMAGAAHAAPASVPSGGKPAALTGQAVYQGLCYGCHRDGVGGAPKFGDKMAWEPRIAQGFDTLVKHAIQGFSGKSGKMPPRGGGNFADEEVARAVAYMANHAGASFPESPKPANK